MASSKLDLMKGTLDLMVLQTLAAMGSMHGYGIARRIEQVSGDKVLLIKGTIYAALGKRSEPGMDRGRSGALPRTTVGPSITSSPERAGNSWQKMLRTGAGSPV